MTELIKVPYFELPPHHRLGKDGNGDPIYMNKITGQSRKAEQTGEKWYPKRKRSPAPGKLGVTPAQLGRCMCTAGLPSGSTYFHGQSANIKPSVNPAETGDLFHYIWVGMAQLDSAGDWARIIHPLMFFDAANDTAWQAWPTFFDVNTLYGTTSVSMVYQDVWLGYSYRTGTTWVSAWEAPAGKTSPSPFEFDDSYWVDGFPTVANAGDYEVSHPSSAYTGCTNLAPWNEWYNGAWSTDQGNLPNNLWVGGVALDSETPPQPLCGCAVDIVTNSGTASDVLLKTYAI